MAILPIDIQTIMGQMNHVSRNQFQAEHAAVTQQQHFGNAIQHKTIEKDKQVNTLDHTDNEDKIINPDKEHQSESFQQESEKKHEHQSPPSSAPSLYKDPDKGNIIDIKK